MQRRLRPRWMMELADVISVNRGRAREFRAGAGVVSDDELAAHLEAEAERRDRFVRGFGAMAEQPATAAPADSQVRTLWIRGIAPRLRGDSSVLRALVVGGRKSVRAHDAAVDAGLPQSLRRPIRRQAMRDHASLAFLERRLRGMRRR